MMCDVVEELMQMLMQAWESEDNILLSLDDLREGILVVAAASISSLSLSRELRAMLDGYPGLPMREIESTAREDKSERGVWGRVRQ